MAPRWPPATWWMGEAMTWPVRGLEFVLYPRAAVASASRSPRFALNLNVGPRMPLHRSTDAAAEPTHWFVIDLAILREHGLALHGPPAHELVAPIPRRWLLDALGDGLAWHAANEPALHQSVLNAAVPGASPSRGCGRPRTPPRVGCWLGPRTLA